MEVCETLNQERTPICAGVVLRTHLLIINFCTGEKKDFEVYSCHASPDGSRLVTAAGGTKHRAPFSHVRKAQSGTCLLIGVKRWPCPNMVYGCHLQCRRREVLEAEAARFHELSLRDDTHGSFFADGSLCGFWRGRQDCLRLYPRSYASVAHIYIWYVLKKWGAPQGTMMLKVLGRNKRATSG